MRTVVLMLFEPVGWRTSPYGITFLVQGLNSINAVGGSRVTPTVASVEHSVVKNTFPPCDNASEGHFDGPDTNFTLLPKGDESWHFLSIHGLRIPIVH